MHYVVKSQATSKASYEKHFTLTSNIWYQGRNRDEALVAARQAAEYGDRSTDGRVTVHGDGKLIAEWTKPFHWRKIA